MTKQSKRTDIMSADRTWARAAKGDDVIVLRHAVASDAAHLALWDTDPGVIACASDNEDAQFAFGADWAEELAMQSSVFFYLIAEHEGRPIGAMGVIDPHLEPTHYWGDIEPNLRALDIWIGDAADRDRGFGTAMMRAAIDTCFAEPNVTAIVIDPLNTNTEAHRFYQRLGFTPVGRRTFGDDDCLVHRLERADWRSRK